MGDTTANIVYQGRSGCCSGLDQIVFQVPAKVTGCYVPVAVETGGIVGNIGNYATIAVSDGGETCSDSIMGSDLVSQLAAGQNVSFGYIRLESWIGNFLAGVGSGQASDDRGYATFSQYTPATAGLAQYGVSRAYCAPVDCSYGCGAVMDYTADISDSSPAQLDAGTISLQRTPATSLTQPFAGNPYSGGGLYYGFLSTNGRYLWSGLTYPVAGSGGAGVGAFSVSDATSTNVSLMFTGLTNAQTIPLTGDLTLHWTSNSQTQQSGDITIYAQSGSATNQFGFIQCTVPASAQSFTIPARVMAVLPVSGTGGTAPYQFPEGWLQIGQYNTSTSFNAPGLTSGIITDIFFNGVGVYFK